MTKLGLIGLLGAVLISGCATHKNNDKSEVIRPFVYIEKLVVNTKNSKRNVVRKNEEEGIKDLRKLAENSLAEEVFAYVPSEETWYELGSNESWCYGYRKINLDSEDKIRFNFPYKRFPIFQFGSNIDLDFYLNLDNKYPQIKIYHFHPSGKRVVNRIAKDYILDGYVGNWSKGLNSLPFFSNRLDDIIKIYSYHLSEADILQFFNLIGEKNITSLRSYSVVSTLGVAEVSVSNEGIGFIKSLSPFDNYKFGQRFYKNIPESSDLMFDPVNFNLENVNYSFIPFE